MKHTPQGVDNLSIRHAFVMVCYGVQCLHKDCFTPTSCNWGGWGVPATCVIIQNILLNHSHQCPEIVEANPVDDGPAEIKRGKDSPQAGPHQNL